MDKLKALMRQPEIYILLFCLAFFLFVRPLLVMAGIKSASAVLLSLFLPWIIVIVVLWFMDSRWVAPPPESPDREDGEMTDV